jgi:hypothetical protein
MVRRTFIAYPTPRHVAALIGAFVGLVTLGWVRLDLQTPILVWGLRRRARGKRK